MPQILREPANRFMVLGVAFLLFIIACSATVLYWSLDLEYPLTGVTGTFKGWDPDRPNRARIEWTGQRHRYCDATVSHWVINGGRYVDFYTTERPGSGLVMNGEKGHPDVIYETIEIPSDMKKNLHNPKYRVRFEFACNPLQKVFPIIVAPPELNMTPEEIVTP